MPLKNTSNNLMFFFQRSVKMSTEDKTGIRRLTGNFYFDIFWHVNNEYGQYG